MRATVLAAALAGGLIAATSALAVEQCNVDGRWINLNHGGMLANLTGKVMCVNDGKPTREIPYVNGKVHGTERRLGGMGASGKIVETEYREGKRNGVMRTLDAATNRVESEVSYRDDREFGKARYFHPSGKLRREVDRTETDLTTLAREFDEEGRLTRMSCGSSTSMPIGRGECRNPGFSGVLRTFNPDGSPREVLPMKDGLIDGVAETFGRGGAIARRETMAGGVLHGIAQLFAENGAVLEEASFERGIPHGPARRFYDRDRVALEWRVQQGVFVAEIARWQNGELRAETTRSEGRVDAKGYHDNGKLRFTGAFAESPEVMRPWRDSSRMTVYATPRLRDLQRQTDWGASALWTTRLRPIDTHKTFYENGKPESEENFANGRRDGLRRVWDAKGTLRLETRYANDKRVAEKEWDDAGKLVSDDEFFDDGSRKRR